MHIIFGYAMLLKEKQLVKQQKYFFNSFVLSFSLFVVLLHAKTVEFLVRYLKFSAFCW
jgi:hypothetical protein